MGEEGAVIACHNLDVWSQHIQLANDAKKLVVVDFTASWCGPCRMIAPFFQDLAKKFTDAVFLKVDVDELKPVAEEFNVNAMPTFIFMKEGTIVDRLVGAQKEALPKKIEKHLGK